MAIGYVSSLPRGADVVIVGGGIVGSTTAFHAARAGLRPLMIERRPALATLTTAAAAGGFRLQHDSEVELRLARESVDEFVHFADLTRQREYDPALRQRGYLWVTLTDRGAGRQRRLVEAQRSWGLDDVEVLAGDEARSRFPFLSPEVVQARYRAGDGTIDPKALTFGYAAAACAAGASVAVRCEVTGIRVAAGRAVGVETTDGVVGADAVVVAAGPFSGRVAGLAGVRLPLTALRRQKAVIPEVPAVPTDAPMTIDEDTAAHWRPMFGGAALLFTDPQTTPEPPAAELPVDIGFVFRLLDPASPVSLARFTPFWRGVWEHGAAHWYLQAGQYTMTPDHLPLIGPTEVEGLYVNTGYSGHGVMLSPAGSRMLVDTLTGALTRESNPFGVGRVFERTGEPGLL